MKTIITQIDMYIESLISDSRTNEKLKAIRNKIAEEKEIKQSEIELLIELVIL